MFTSQPYKFSAIRQPYQVVLLLHAGIIEDIYRSYASHDRDEPFLPDSADDPSEGSLITVRGYAAYLGMKTEDQVSRSTQH